MPSLNIIIPAAGAGRRMPNGEAPFLVNLGGGHTVLDRQIRLFRNLFPGAETTVILGYKSEDIVEESVLWTTPIFNRWYEETNTLYSVGLGLSQSVHSRVLVAHGDLVFNKDAVSWAAMGESCLLVDSRKQIRGSEVGVSILDDHVVRLGYGLPLKWGQIVLFANRELDLLEEVVANSEYRYHCMFEAINLIIEQGGMFRVVEPPSSQVAEIDTVKDMARARSIDREFPV